MILHLTEELEIKSILSSSQYSTDIIPLNFQNVVTSFSNVVAFQQDISLNYYYYDLTKK